MNKAAGLSKPAAVIVSSAKKKPPVLPGEIKSFSKNKNAELEARRECWRKNNLRI